MLISFLVGFILMSFAHLGYFYRVIRFFKECVMKTRVTVVGSEFVVRHYDNNRKSESYICKCVTHDPETGAVDVGTLRVPAVLAPDGVLPGDYNIDFRAGRSFSDDGIVGRLCLLEAVSASGVKPVSSVEDRKKAATVAV
jgi:hypothetical protein